MSFADLSPLANHLWQATLCTVVAWLLTLALRKNRAAVRYWIWLAASAKFLIPFAWMARLGARFVWPVAPVAGTARIPVLVEQIGQPFQTLEATALPAGAAPVAHLWSAVLLGVWLCGMAVGVVFWIRSARRMGGILRGAKALDLNLPIPVMAAPGQMEPGVFGIWRPVLLLPEGITETLTPGQLETILSHELRHVHRRDNLTAAIHLLVETVFWFHPAVWWIRTRLVEERERACDEGVLLLGSQPQVYAESILKVCELYLSAPVAFAAGVTGGELKKRIEGIMENRFGLRLGLGKKALLATAALAAMTLPLALGVIHAGAQTEAAGPLPRFEVASVKLIPPGAPRRTGIEVYPGGRVVVPGEKPFFASLVALSALAAQDATNQPKFEVASVKRTDRCFAGNNSIDPGSVTLRGVPLKAVLMEAFNVKMEQIEGPSWLEPDCFEISAKIPEGATRDQVPAMLQALLTERFRLAAHKEDRLRSGYALVVDKGGPKVKVDYPNGNFMGSHAGQMFYGAFGHGALKGVMTMATLAANLSTQGYGPVQDLTGLTGKYDIDLTWTPDKAFEPRAVDVTASAATPPSADIPAPEANLFTALRESLGLKLERRQMQVQFLVVDHIERIPTEN